MMTPNVNLFEEVERYVDTYPRFPEHSMRTGDYLFPLLPDSIDESESDAALTGFRNVYHAETWGVPESTKKRRPLFRTFLRARRFIQTKTAAANATNACFAKPFSFIAVRKRAASAESEQADAIRSKLQVKDNEPISDSTVDEMPGTFVF